MKATYGEVNGEGRPIFKDPKTDDGTKKSAKGMIKLSGTPTEVKRMEDMVSPQEEKEGLLKTVYLDGKIIKETTLAEIRSLLKLQSNSEVITP